MDSVKFWAGLLMGGTLTWILSHGWRIYSGEREIRQLKEQIRELERRLEQQEMKELFPWMNRKKTAG